MKIMSKDVCKSIVALMFACGGALTMRNVVEAKAYHGELGLAEYVSVENAPVIDGIYDDIWNKTDSVTTDEAGHGSRGRISVMWNETGLYFFAKVEDVTLNTRDLCNFWVSETYYDAGSYTYVSLDGAYYLCLNPEGENQYYLPGSIDSSKYVDMQGKYQVATQIQENVYCIELYVPLTGSNDLFLHNSIGFNVSVDDYLTENSDRDSYSYWCATGNYWENPANCGEMLLVDAYPEEGKAAPVKTVEENGTSTPDDLNSSNTQGDNSVETTLGQGNLGCSATVGTMSCLVVLGVGIAVLRKKRD